MLHLETKTKNAIVLSKNKTTFLKDNFYSSYKNWFLLELEYIFLQNERQRHILKMIRPLLYRDKGLWGKFSWRRIIYLSNIYCH